MSVIDTVSNFVNKHLPRSGRVIVGLSGGADSVALLVALVDAGVECVAAHCNFHLRGEESNRDHRFCEELCGRLGVELLSRDFDVAARQAETSESVEMACRSLRYDWWRGLIEAGKGDFIAVGHHREDNVETFFINLLRGSGITGLKGMLPVNGHVIRPMLQLSRPQIEEFLTSRGYTWVVDRTNLENEYRRNKLRNIILPVIEREFSGAMDSIERSIEILRDTQSFYADAVSSGVGRYVRENGDVDVKTMVENEPHHSTLLYELLSEKGFSFSQIKNVIDGVKDGRSGQVFEVKEQEYVLDRGILRLMADESCWREVSSTDLHELPLSVETILADVFFEKMRTKSLDRDSLYLDSSALEGDPVWSLRSWSKGDRISPFGMKGSRLVSDLFNDAKYSAIQKNSTPLLFRNRELLWVVGLRTSRHFQVRESSGYVIKISMISKS
ncbi:tRNA lysidine(34) synthetase TilS [uncultured Duncaniella sp.]|uniref:tRNA lysidine(34) synthetase TilS n=1 Tax=uncultured Duncaniella sp. TaxID=2768039 RepID=UPI0026764B23|nr:tRNA lysidine(34) synthetase TilS [uncultured Duncaniella sp.]